MSAAGNQQMGPAPSRPSEAGPFKKPTAGWGKALTRMNLSGSWPHEPNTVCACLDCAAKYLNISEHLSEAAS